MASERAAEAVKDFVPGVMGGEEDSLLSSDEATGRSTASSSRRQRAALLAVLLGCVGAAAAITRFGSLRSGSPLQFRGAEFLEEKAAFAGQCGAMDQNMDYELSVADQEIFGTNMDHVPSAEMCCAMCQGVPQCKSWTWIKDALPDGCHGQCWLKGGLPINKVPQLGLVSGLAPPRPELDEAALMAKAPVPATTATGAVAPAAGGATVPTVHDEVFCFSLMVPFGCGATCPPATATPSGQEYELVQLQWSLQTSIFACDSYAVYSNRTVQIADGLTTTAVDVDLTVKFGGDSYTALNSWIFIAVWKQVLDEGRHLTSNWIAKVDPDAVFFPDRLRPILAAHAGAGYINNCKFGLHGPIEVLSSKAMMTLQQDYDASWDKKAPAQCVKELHFGQWGEDFFLSQCLWKVHGVERDLAPELMCEAHCACDDWYWCQTAGAPVTYHPFKRPDMYRQCLANSLAVQPMAK